jgi:dienelactone hydrolase/predicted Ser/Thr protein kinase
MEELAPETLLAGKYRILEVVGRGGMGIVYEAEDTKLQRHVALKFLPPELVLSQEARERFVQEARAAAALSHPNICTIYEIHDEGEKPFIAMEYIEGQSLKAKMAKNLISTEDALSLAIQVSEGLEEAHKKGIIHRDIKSANIMVTDRGQAKIMDFGLAKVKGGTLLTREGTTLGTVAYMSPEQALGKQVDHRTDIWSLGVVLYELLSGRLPFQGDHEASILYTVVHEEPKPLKAVKPDVAPELQQVVSRALKKNPEARYPSADEMGKDLRKFQDSLKAEGRKAFSLRALLRRLRKPIVAIPAALGLIAIALAAVWFFNRQAKIRWARDVAIPQIKEIIANPEAGSTHHLKAYRLAEEAEKYIPKDSQLAELFASCSKRISVTSEPPGAKAFVKPYSAPESEWRFLGVTPLQNIRMPIGHFRWKLEKEDYETVLAVAPTFEYDLALKGMLKPYNIFRMLDKKGGIPMGMVRVAGAETDEGKVADFYLDAHEVTNKEYKEFINSGGYSDRKYWKHPFIKEGKVLTWEEAMSEFVDRSGQLGPATWQAGDYPEGQEDYPVSGISWYEAAAYAEFAGKSLPSAYHWGMGRGGFTPLLVDIGTFFSLISTMSNFKADGPVAVGSSPGMTAYGAMDMAGNVREWCWNETSKGKLIRGGAWNDAHYMFNDLTQSPPFDRSPKNGFRCALYLEPEKIPEKVFAAFEFDEQIDYYKQTPVPDSIFQVYKEQFSYDKTDLNARVEWKNEDSKDWTQEKITFDAAYGKERVTAYLFLPKNSTPPFQTVIYFPGAGSAYQPSSQEMDKYMEFTYFLSFIVKNKRAVLYPVYKGTFERKDETLADAGADSHQYTEYVIQLVKDLKRSVDYLETRPEIASQKLAYMGFSWGSWLGGTIILAVEERLKASILVVGGLWNLGRPEVNPVNYVRHVRLPTLMLNGRYDMAFPYETTVKPMFDLLGTPVAQKKSLVYDMDHFVPRNELIKETLAWLDKYLGPVR